MKINIPKNPVKLILLAMKILAKHLADGAASVLIFLDMADLQAKTTEANTQHALAEDYNKDKKKATQARDLAIGEYNNSTQRGTLRFYITSGRTVLLGIYQGNERKLGEWGFEVNADMSVVIPKNATELILLAKNILAKHAADGASSPLNSLDMADMMDKYSIADTNNTLTESLDRAKEEAYENRDIALGHAKNQDSYTPGTVVFTVHSVKDALLSVFRGRERNLGDWGFGVTAGTGGGTASTDFINIPVDQTTPSTVAPKIQGKATATGTKQFKLDWGDGNSTIGTVENGVLRSYPHTYIIPGQYNIKATAITAGALEEFDVLQADNCKLFGTITIPANVQLSGLQVPNNLVTRVLMQPACYAFLVSFILYNNNMDASSVNENLIGLDNSGLLNGIANFGGGTNNAPTGLGIAAKNSLIAKGWTVLTN